MDVVIDVVGHRELTMITNRGRSQDARTDAAPSGNVDNSRDLEGMYPTPMEYTEEAVMRQAIRRPGRGQALGRE